MTVPQISHICPLNLKLNILTNTVVPLFYNPLLYFQTSLDHKTAQFGPKVPLCVVNDLYFKTTCNIRPHFLGPMGGLKREGLPYPISCFCRLCVTQTLETYSFQNNYLPLIISFVAIESLTKKPPVDCINNYNG